MLTRGKKKKEKKSISHPRHPEGESSKICQASLSIMMKYTKTFPFSQNLHSSFTTTILFSGTAGGPRAQNFAK
jgi:hypothetical protein